MAAKISTCAALVIALVSTALLVTSGTERAWQLVVPMAFAVIMVWFPDWFERTIPSKVDPKTVRGVTLATAWAILLVGLAIAIGISL
ncbi:MAG TPA: hypothetical protein VMZ92_20155 [Planctomycetota bacterium]|nr:hypothetical protein [Planctomycetota bacterium]